MKHFTIRRGEHPPDDPSPNGPVADAEAISSVAILGGDWPGMRPHLEVEVGARVTRGQVLFVDRRHRQVCFVSPSSGVVEDITYGPRRTLDVLEIRVEADAAAPTVPPEVDCRERPRETLLSAGFWPAFRTRPYGRVPEPDAEPDAIVVNAVHAAPQAPDPMLVMDKSVGDFHLGCELLTRLTQGAVHVCQSPGSPLGPDHERIRHASFSGTVASGLAGTQIDRLCRGMSVWSIGYQDVAAIGHYFSTGDYPGTRVVSVTGPMALPPRLLRVPVGARIADLTGAEPARALSGSRSSGREAVFLRRFDEQITLLPATSGKRLYPLRQGKLSQCAAIPSRALDRSIAIDVLSVPLLRALSIGDAEAAERLGCLALDEEDLAVATRRCTSGVDYGVCLRGVLAELMAEAA